MTSPVLRLGPRFRVAPGTGTDGTRRPGLGDVLVAQGVLSRDQVDALTRHESWQETDLGAAIRVRGLASDGQIADALAICHGTDRADLVNRPPEPGLVEEFGAEACLKGGFVPLRRIGGGILVATARPEEFPAQRARLADRHGRVMMTVATETEIVRAVAETCGRRLAVRAEARVAPEDSCRDLASSRRLARFGAAAAAVALGLIAAPGALLAGLAAVASLFLVALTALRVAALVLHFRRGGREERMADAPLSRSGLPVVSLLVPLFRESEIADHLVARLAAIDYPAERLDVCLVLEEDDLTTRALIGRTSLPLNMRVIEVPRGRLRTKPRALNYALAFARGSIIGVYDAEDAPAPQQVREIVRRFGNRGPDVACLQAVLDYYNPGQNWLARCFTIEYATWFRLILPALEALRLPVPLGGTSVFFRREALETLGAWDSHNVTEDADLGMRLARHGYRTEVVQSVTLEEANCRLAPWIRQRSRWIKGYAITWAVHSHRPRRLWRDLGPRGFFGLQLLFLGTLTQFLLAPVLWSFWIVPFGLPHPAADVLPGGSMTALAAAFLLSEVVGVATAAAAVRGPGHRWLLPWVPTLALYFPFATVAAWKGVWEIAMRPFFWDKTSHGHSLRPGNAAPAQRDVGPD